MAVTKEQIFTAADALAAEGLRPTLEAVRQRIGGSYSTISPALNEWKARQAAKALPLREPTPQVVADRLAEVGAEVWSIALELANARLAAEREALEKARGEIEDERNEATELADRLAAQIEELQSRLASIEAAEQAARSEAGELCARHSPRPASRPASPMPERTSCALSSTTCTKTPNGRAKRSRRPVKRPQACAASSRRSRPTLYRWVPASALA